MFTPKTLLPLAALVLAGAFLGCEKPLDSPEYGELIKQVPPELNRPYPLPELDPPTTDPLPKPVPLNPDAGEAAAENPGKQAPEEAPKAEKPANGEQNPE